MLQGPSGAVEANTSVVFWHTAYQDWPTNVGAAFPQGVPPNEGRLNERGANGPAGVEATQSAGGAAVNMTYCVVVAVSPPVSLYVASPVRAVKAATEAASRAPAVPKLLAGFFQTTTCGDMPGMLKRGE